MIDGIQRWINIKETHKQFIKYLIVGGSTALGELIFFTLLVREALLTIEISNIAAVCMATVLNFMLNRAWSFQSRSKINRSLILYIGLFFFNMAFSTYAIHYMVKLGVMDIWAKLFTMVIITVWNFVLYRKIIFVS